MDEVVNTIAGKTGVPAETVQKVLAAAVEHIKGQLPPHFASQVDMFLKGGGGAGGPGSGASVGNPLTGLLGGQ